MKIMVCYDGSAEATKALKLSVKRAQAVNAEVYLIHSMTGGLEVHKRDFVNAEHDLSRAQRLFDNEKVCCEPKLLVRGLNPGEDLVRFADEKKVDEIIIGIKKRSKVGKLFFGSTAQHVILHATCPVVTVR
ncbi:MAG: universal stress protein [Thermodesulfobacteriota bacterium]|nr:universal stress protein [Thermodesulfobacteriota bacterium]